MKVHRRAACCANDKPQGYDDPIKKRKIERAITQRLAMKADRANPRTERARLTSLPKRRKAPSAVEL
jgi:hypothetical protein